MNVLKRIVSRFTARGRSLALVSQGRICAVKGDTANAIKHYTKVVDSPESPRDVVAMALLNRALVFSRVGEEQRATSDLNVILGMPQSIPVIKKSARDKLVRIKRKNKG